MSLEQGAEWWNVDQKGVVLFGEGRRSGVLRVRRGCENLRVLNSIEDPSKPGVMSGVVLEDSPNQINIKMTLLNEL